MKKDLARVDGECCKRGTGSTASTGVIDPGITGVVSLLQRWHFITTDSGDGVTKLAAGWEPYAEALPYPHVFMRVRDEECISEGRRLLANLEDCGVLIAAPGCPGASIQVTADPTTDVAVLMLIGLNDETLASSLASAAVDPQVPDTGKPSTRDPKSSSMETSE